MAFSETYAVQADLAVLGSRRRPGRLMNPGVRFIVAHDTGNPGAGARAHARWYRNDPNPPLATVSSAHLFVDDEAIIETIPVLTGPPEQALHVLNNRPTDNQLYGHDANRAAVGVEYCYGGAIDPQQAYNRYVWLLARLCDRFSLNPSRAVVGHQVLDPGRKSDPGQGLRASGRSYEALLKDVVAVFLANGGAPQHVSLDKLVVGEAVTTVNLAVRPEPGRLRPPMRVIGPDRPVAVAQIVSGETVSGNDDWAQLADGGFVWTGGLRQARP